ncbi:hypothetical protein AZ016_001447, partial [Klebsiella pneumoniae]
MASGIICSRTSCTCAEVNNFVYPSPSLTPSNT